MHKIRVNCLLLLVLLTATLPSFAGELPKCQGNIVLGFEDKTFCYQTGPVDKKAPLAPLPVQETLRGETLPLQTVEAVALLHTLMRDDRLEGNFGQLTSTLVKLYGNLRYLQLSGSGQEILAENETAYRILRSSIFLAQKQNASRKLSHLRLKKIKKLTEELVKVLNDPKKSTCQDQYQERIRTLSKKAFLKAPLIAAGSGTVAALGSAVAMDLLGREAVLRLVELFGTQAVTGLVGSIPFAGGVLAASLALITYKGIVISKLVKTAKTLGLVKDAHSGEGKSLARLIKKLAEKATLPPSLALADSKTRIKLASQAVSNLDSSGALCNGLLTRSSTQNTEDQPLWTVIRNRTDAIGFPSYGDDSNASTKNVITYLSNNPDLLAMPARANLGIDATALELSVDGKVLSLPSIESLVLKMRTDAGKGKLDLYTREGQLTKEMRTDMRKLLQEGKGPGKILTTGGLNDSVHRTIIIYGLESHEEKNQVNSLGHFDYLTVQDKVEKEGLGLALSPGGMVVAFNVKAMPQGLIGADVDSDFESCLLATQKGERQVSDTGSEDQIHAQIVANGDALKVQTLRNSLRGSRAIWVTDLMVKNGWKRITTSIPVLENGELGDSITQKECRSSSYVFPALRSIFTGHLSLELGVQN